MALSPLGSHPCAGIREGRADIVTSQRIAARYATQIGLPIGGEAARMKG